MEDESFPRGGVQKHEPKKKHKQSDKDLFQDSNDQKRNKNSQENNELASKHIKQDVLFTNKKKPGAKQKNAEKRKEISKDGGKVEEKRKLMELSSKDVCQEMLVLGYITEIKDYSVEMALPNGRRGEVSITNISDAYVESLRKSVQNTEDDEEESESLPPSLADLFKIGTLFPCLVLQNEKSRVLFQLSINPRLTNVNLTLDSILNSAVFYGSICSVEDHGYIVYTGVEDRKGLLKNTDATSFIDNCNDGQCLKVGQVFPCRILQQQTSKNKSMKNMKYLPLTVDIGELNEIKKTKDLKLTDFVPGMKVTAKIIQVGDQSVSVWFLKHKGLIHMSHLPERLSTFSVGDRVLCCVLYITPQNQSVTLSALPHIVNYRGEPVHLLGFGSLFVGSLVRNATVSHVKLSKGVFVKLEGNATGLANMDNTEEDKEYKKGSCHRCVVTAIDYEENKVQVSFKEDTIRELVNRPGDFVGDVVTCKFDGMQDKSGVVNVMDKFAGKLTAAQQAKNVSYTPGMIFKCRVLSVSDNGVMTLTNKPWALDTKYPIVTEMQQVEAGQVLEGFVLSDKKPNIKVKFYGQLTGIIPKQWTDAGEQLKHGERVVCRVLFLTHDTLMLCLEENFEEFSVPPHKVGFILQDGASAIKSIQKSTRTWIHVSKETCQVCGSKENRSRAKQEVLQIVNTTDNGHGKLRVPESKGGESSSEEQISDSEDSSDSDHSTPKSNDKTSSTESLKPKSGIKRSNLESNVHESSQKKQKSSASTEEISIDSKDCGKVIGPKGSIIQEITRKSGAKVIISSNKDGLKSTITISGSDKSIINAKILVENALKKQRNGNL